MIKKIAWNTFKNTGDLNTYLELKQIQDIEAQMNIQKVQQQMEEQNGNYQNEWNNNFGK